MAEIQTTPQSGVFAHAPASATKVTRQPESDELDINKILTEPLPLEVQADCVVPGLCTGEAGGLFGAGKSGKSFLSLQIAVGTAVGRDLTATEACPGIGLSGQGHALYIALEDSEARVWRRIKTLAACLSVEEQTLLCRHLHVVVRQGQLIDVLGAGMAELQRKAVECRFVALDTLSHLHRTDEKETRDMTAVARQLTALAVDSGAAVMVLHHLNKAAIRDGVVDPAVASRGAVALVNELRWGAVLAPMTIAESKDYGKGRCINGVWERSAFARFCIPLLNDGAVPPDVWLHRQANGFFEAVRLEAKKKSTQTQKATHSTVKKAKGKAEKSSTVADWLDGED